MRLDKRRTAITGMGVVCAIGNDTEHMWQGVAAGECGIRDIQQLDTLWMGVRVAGEVRDFDVSRYLDADEAAEVVRSGWFAVAAAREAMGQAGLDLDSLDAFRVGVSMGTCQGSLGEVQGVNPHIVDSVHYACDALANHLGVRGPRAMVSTACSAGANAIGFAQTKLWNDEVDVMLAGGTDALTFFSLAGFGIMGSLSPGACAPYSRSDGLSLGEGAAIVVLEPWDRAVERGATILGELLGFGTSADAYHPSAPDPSGRGASLAMRRALAQGGISPDQVSYVNGHGTATPANDAMERKAMRTVFGERAPEVPCSSTKSQVGHTLGAAGAIETLVSVLAAHHDVLPPTVNFDETVESDLDFVPNRARPHPVDVVVSNSYAFGGSNASIVVGKPGKVAPVFTPARPDEDVVVTGIGAVGALGVGVEEWWSAMEAGECGLTTIPAFRGTGLERYLGGPTPDLRPKGFAPAGVWRKLDVLGRISLAASRLAWRDAEIDLSPAEMENVALYFGTNAGSIEHTELFDRGARAGAAQANPILFPNAVLNSAAGHVCTALGLRGPTCTFTTGGASAVLALTYAADLIRQGDIDVALVMAGDTLYETMFTAAAALDLLTEEKVRPFDERADGTGISGSSVTFVLESAGHAAARGARTYCRILGHGTTSNRFSFRAGDGGGAEWGEAMRLAVERSGVGPEQLGYVAAAAGGIPLVDQAEAHALAKVVGSQVPVGAPKSLAGDTLGAAGLVGSLAAILALHRGMLTPTANLKRPHSDVVLEHVTEPGARADVAYALVNAAAIGGTYAGVVLGRAAS